MDDEQQTGFAAGSRFVHREQLAIRPHGKGSGVAQPFGDAFQA